MSNLPPNQSSPFATAPEVTGKPKKSGGVVVLIIGLVFGLVFVLLACGGLAIALLLPAVSNARNAARQMGENNNLKIVGLALHNYHSVYNQLPCTVRTDADGKVVTTWRTSLVDFLDGIPTTNASPAAPLPLRPLDSVSANETNVFAIVSPNGMFLPTPNADVRFSDAVDGLSNTIMAIKLPNRSTDWSSTNNLTPDEAYGAIQSITKQEAGFLLMADGAVSRIVLPMDRKTFDAWITRDGGEAVPSY
ncbi:MAG: DUF1559 domain-containing protein [Rubripirellula sp.]